MRFTFRQLEYFIATADAGSISAASKSVNVSQPAISIAIARLEEELGVELFVRHHAQRLLLTSQGRFLLDQAKQVIKAADAFASAAGDFREFGNDELVLGCLGTLAPMLIPELGKSFKAQFPTSKIKLVGSNHRDLIDGVAHGSIELALTYDLDLPKGICFTPLANVHPYVVVGEQHPMSERSHLSLRDLAAESLVLTSFPVCQKYFVSLFRTAGIEPLISMEAATVETMWNAVSRGFGYTLTNLRPLAEPVFDGRRLVRLPLVDRTRPLTIGLIVSDAGPRSEIARAFEQHCRRLVSDSYIPGMGPAIGTEPLQGTTELRHHTHTLAAGLALHPGGGMTPAH